MNRIKDYKQLAEDISLWIKDYATTNNIKSLVVGVSGGIDSAVVSTLCALTGLPTFCAIIDIHSNKEHTVRAVGHCNYLDDDFSNVTWRHLNMDKTMETIMIPNNGNIEHLAANTKSRLRMLTLYNYAGAGQGIVVGTGNRVEDFGVGFFTLGGDGQTDLNPIADLYKTEVRELGRYLGISQEILDAAPTDGLWSDGRTDEDQIGATYEELEWVMNNLERPHHEEEDNNYFSDRRIEVLKIYSKLHKKNQHKMIPIPVYKINKHI